MELMAMRIRAIVAWTDTVQSCRYTAHTSTAISWYALLPIYQTALRHSLEEGDTDFCLIALISMASESKLSENMEFHTSSVQQKATADSNKDISRFVSSVMRRYAFFFKVNSVSE
jgi:hypothetical protein